MMEEGVLAEMAERLNGGDSDNSNNNNEEDDDDTTTIEYEIEVIESSSSASLSLVSNLLLADTQAPLEDNSNQQQQQHYVINQIEDEDDQHQQVQSEEFEAKPIDFILITSSPQEITECPTIEPQEEEEEELHSSDIEVSIDPGCQINSLADALEESPSSDDSSGEEDETEEEEDEEEEEEEEEVLIEIETVSDRCQEIPCTESLTTIDVVDEPQQTNNIDQLNEADDLKEANGVEAPAEVDAQEDNLDAESEVIEQFAALQLSNDTSELVAPPPPAEAQQDNETSNTTASEQVPPKLVHLSEPVAPLSTSTTLPASEPMLILDSHDEQQVEPAEQQQQPPSSPPAQVEPVEVVEVAEVEDSQLDGHATMQMEPKIEPVSKASTWKGQHLEDYGCIGQTVSVCVYDTGEVNQWPTPIGQCDNFDNSYIDDDDELERELDEEPEFVGRQVEVKRGRDLRCDYTLGLELGRGKFGTVFRCRELASGREFAAKFVHMRRREDREDVLREIEIMSRLQHKRLLQLYDAYEDDALGQEMCLITELVEGGELFERIIDDDFELTERKAAIFMRQICEGVAYMHSMGIVHLDMKPENILCVSRSGCRIKVIDFGLARQLKPEEPLRVMFGTPDFAAPEVLAYDLVSLATDMWSVGVICYVLLSGLSPFMGDNDMETMANVTRATYDFDDQAFDPISDLAKDFISRLLVREQAKRLKPSECLKHPWLQRGGQQLEMARRATYRRQSMVPLGDNSRQANAAGGHLQEADRSYTLPLMVNLDKRNLKKYVVRRKWHKTVHAIMALGRMGAHLKH